MFKHPLLEICPTTVRQLAIQLGGGRSRSPLWCLHTGLVRTLSDRQQRQQAGRAHNPSRAKAHVARLRCLGQHRSVAGGTPSSSSSQQPSASLWDRRVPRQDAPELLGEEDPTQKKMPRHETLAIPEDCHGSRAVSIAGDADCGRRW
jgi:hypothetical protein